MSQALSRGEAVELVTVELRRAILDGQLRPGQRIGQASVAERYGVSRLPVREALRALENEGLVTLVPNAGARVTRLDAAELDEVYWLRERLEPPLLAESVPQLGDEDRERLRECIDELDRLAAVGDLRCWEEVDRRFHLLSLSRAPLGQVHRIVRTLWNLATPYRLAFIQIAPREVLEIGQMDHRLILDAAERQDQFEAERIQAIHIRRTRLGLREHPELFDRTATNGGSA
jgi:DNA-binding GntR family transcriptional regulator